MIEFNTVKISHTNLIDLDFSNKTLFLFYLFYVVRILRIFVYEMLIQILQRQASDIIISSPNLMGYIFNIQN